MTSADPVWVDEADALALHDRLLAFHGGLAGLRDAGLPQSAIARPHQLAASGEDVDVFALAGAYSAGIVKNHPFLDGNMRTGFVVGVLFLELNGYRFGATEAAAAEAVLGLAAGAISEAEYREFLRGNCAREA